MPFHENKVFTDLLEKSEEHLANYLPFVLYRKPGEHSVLGLFQNDDKLQVSENYDTSGFIFAPYESEGPSILTRPDLAISCDFTAINKAHKPGLNDEKDGLERELYMELINKALKEIQGSDMRKVVLSRKLEIKAVVQPLAVFQEILSLYPNALCYLWYHPKIGLWAGASPEVFLSVKSGKIKTMALAGTQKVRAGQPPAWGIKEKQEQSLVTAYILEALDDLVEELSASKVESVRAGDLWHLKTTIIASQQRRSLKDIISALHPTPAICGLPLREAKAFIAQHEQYKRAYYTGFLGELNMGKSKNTALFVNLRCLQICAESTFIYVGGGITKDSVPENEWQETVDKSEIMSRAVLNSME